MNRKAKIGLMQENNLFLNDHQLWWVPLKGNEIFYATEWNNMLQKM
jgi:hypothetical protein